jgi:hypothetical protein
MIEIIVGLALFFVMLAVGVLFLYFIKVVIGKMEKYFLSREETLVFIGVALIATGWILGVEILFGAGIGIIFADWILNWDRILERYRPKKES